MDEDDDDDDDDDAFEADEIVELDERAELFMEVKLEDVLLFADEDDAGEEVEKTF